MKTFVVFLVLVTLTNCGFKVIKKSDFNNFNITEITTEGDKRINFKLKNKLLFNSNKENENKIIIKIFSKKNKSIKEKNIKNEITKYLLSISVDIKYIKLDGGSESEFSVNKSSDYNVANQYSKTLSNEKKSIDLLTNEIADDILDNLRLNLNDL